MQRWRFNAVSAFMMTSALALSGCGPVSASAGTNGEDLETGSDELRELKRKEALADFSQITGAFEALYAPLERKESRYGFRFDALKWQTEFEIRRGRTDRDFLGAFQRFAAKFKDGHISLSYDLTSDSTALYTVPFLVTPFEDRHLLTATVQGFLEATNLSFGDELVAIDNVPVARWIERINPYVGTPNPKGQAQLAAQFLTTRLEYLDSSLVPKEGAQSRFEFVKADGSRVTVELPWSKGFRLPRKEKAPESVGLAFGTSVASDLTQIALERQSELAAYGAAFPFFFTQKSVDVLQPQLVRPSDENLKAFNTPTCAAGGYECYKLASALYEYNGKRILFARVPSYTISVDGLSANAPGYFQALFFEFQSQADVLVLDQTHNPGGNDFFAATLYTSLLREAGPTRGARLNTDRRTLQVFRGNQQSFDGNPDPGAQATFQYFKTIGDELETAIDKDQSLTAVLPQFTLGAQLPPAEQGWKKPFVVLADELSASNGDFVPMLVKASKQGVLFGARTAGLGGNVEEVVTTSNNNITLRLTRNLGVAFKADGKYTDKDFVEDNGVVPDVAYDLKAKDYQEGYTSYVKAFSDVAAGLVK
jgi:hypothetical protein